MSLSAVVINSLTQSRDDLTAYRERIPDHALTEIEDLLTEIGTVLDDELIRRAEDGFFAQPRPAEEGEK